MVSICYCESCQKAGDLLAKLGEAPAVMDKDGGTSFHMQRKDRVEFLKGQENLVGYYLNEKSSTQRVVAKCCQTPLFLEFMHGHWLSVYAVNFKKEDQRPVDIRTMTQACKSDMIFNDDIPSPKTLTLTFMFNLMSAWAKMGFRSPKIKVSSKAKF